MCITKSSLEIRNINIGLMDFLIKNKIIITTVYKFTLGNNSQRGKASFLAPKRIKYQRESLSLLVVIKYYTINVLCSIALQIQN